SFSFSQLLNSDTAVLGQTFLVGRCEDQEVCDEPEPVQGVLKAQGKSLVFTPNNPWEEGVLYRYRIHTASADSDAACVDKTALCAFSAATQRPVLTAFLQETANPDLEVYFRGTQKVDSVQQLLRNLPTADVDANLKFELGESTPNKLENTVKLVAGETDGLIAYVKVGCQ